MTGERSENAFRRIGNPRAETHGPSMNPDRNGREPCSRTPSPSLRARLSSEETACILPASALRTPRSLATPRRPRRTMRSIDVCHPNETACTRTSCVPGESPRLAPRARLAKGLGPTRARPGKRAFHDTLPRFGGSAWDASCRAPGLSPGCGDQGPVRPEAHLGDRASDTPVAPPSDSERPGPSPVGLAAPVFARNAPVGDT